MGKLSKLRKYENNTDISLYQIYVVPSISFQTFLYRHLKLAQSLENAVCYCSTSYDLTNQFMISGSNEQLLQELEYTLLKPECHSW